MRKITLILAILLFVSCVEQRDLYVLVSPKVNVKGDWQQSLGESDMTMKATGIAYPQEGEFLKEYFYAPDNVTLSVSPGFNDVIIFNGLMYSPTETHLDEIYFRGVEKFSTFEAVVAEGTANRRLTRAEDEYIASNNMEILSSATARLDIDREKAYQIKYHNGKNGIIEQPVSKEDSLSLIPVALSYRAQIVATLENVSSAYGANASLHGFVGSVFMAERRPSHFFVTHQFNLNNKKILDKEADLGTIESPVFVTFGPPTDMPDQKYEIYLKIMLINGEERDWTLDITEQIREIIEMIQANMKSDPPVQFSLEIPLSISVSLPKIENYEGGIGVEDWGDDEIIRIEIPK